MAPARVLADASTPRAETLRRTPWIAVLLLAPALVACVLIVDPLREFLSQDDSWAYARMVEHLLKTGEYRLDAWTAASMPVQVYLAAGLAQLFGYSLSLLRISTLLLLVGGLAAYVALLRELEVEPTGAAVLTLGLLASPLVPMLGFTFMSDVQFMAWLIVATWLYARGLRQGSATAMVFGSLAAGCAIGTRQFGIALIGGLALGWLLARPRQRPPLRLLLLATALPIAVGAWQLWSGYAEPTFTQAVRLHEQTDYLTQPPLAFARELAWRIGTVVHYVALLMLPVLPLLLALVIRGRLLGGAGLGVGRQPVDPRRHLLVALAIFGCLLVAALDKSALTTRENSGRALQLPWMLPNAFWNRPTVMHGLAFAGTLGTFLLIVLLLRSKGRAPALRDLPIGWLMAGSIGVCLAALHLAYVQLNDTYLIGLLPFALLIPARALRTSGQPRAALAASALLSAGLLVALSLWMRGNYNWQQAQWQAADRLLAAGIDVKCIGASRHWTEYHGGFDEWLAKTHPNFDPRRGEPSPRHPGALHEPFYEWLHQRYWGGTHQVAVGWTQHAETGWRLIDAVPYTNTRLAPEQVEVFERTAPVPPGSACTAPN